MNEEIINLFSLAVCSCIIMTCHRYDQVLQCRWSLIGTKTPFSLNVVSNAIQSVEPTLTDRITICIRAVHMCSLHVVFGNQIRKSHLSDHRLTRPVSNRYCNVTAVFFLFFLKMLFLLGHL